MRDQAFTVAYCTARKEPRIEWFLDSLGRQLEESDTGKRFQVIIVDFHQDKDARWMNSCSWADKSRVRVIHLPPKPTVWQGPHRLASVDYFAAANARNTALCLAPDGWIAYVDDLSVLMPGWLKAVLEAMERKRSIVLGAYRKVFDLEVENGLVKSFRDDPDGHDVRLRKSKNIRRHCAGEWFYGSSLVAPVEAFLEINGWDEDCDGMGYEDVVTGQLLQNAGWDFVYDPGMMTYESQELHQQEPRMKRLDKGESPHDKSHAILQKAKQSKSASNYFGEGGIRGLRQRVLAGEPFPIVQAPDRDWFDGQPLKEM